MPTRMIRDGILTSERVNALSERAELFYRRLMSVVDDYGRFSANLTLLRASCYPLKLDGVKEDSIKKHLAEAVDAGLIVLYTVGSKQCLQLQDFGQRIQSKSKYPEPPGNGGRLPESTVLHGDPPENTAPYVVGVGVGVGVVIGDEGEETASGKPSPAAPTPAVVLIPLNDGTEYPVTQQQVDEFSMCYPAVDVMALLLRMRAWSISNPTQRKTPKGVLRFVNGWLSKAQDNQPTAGGSRYASASSQQDQRRERARQANEAFAAGVPSVFEASP